MKSIKEKRKYFMNYMTELYDILDPSGDNSKMLHEKYDKYTDEEFDKIIREFFEDEKAQFYLEMIEYERDITLDNIFKAADYQGLKLFQHVALPHLNNDFENVIVTPEPVPVGHIHVKRLPQTVLKKNTGSISIKNRNAKSGQVINEDKNARNSNVETYSMLAAGQEKALQEFMGPRADDMVAKNQMNNEIQKNGYCMLEDLENDPANKRAINSLDEYFIIQGLQTNLVYPLNFIPNPNSDE